MCDLLTAKVSERESIVKASESFFNYLHSIHWSWLKGEISTWLSWLVCLHMSPPTPSSCWAVSFSTLSLAVDCLKWVFTFSGVFFFLFLSSCHLLVVKIVCIAAVDKGGCREKAYLRVKSEIVRRSEMSLPWNIQSTLVFSRYFMRQLVCHHGQVAYLARFSFFFIKLSDKQEFHMTNFFALCDIAESLMRTDKCNSGDNEKQIKHTKLELNEFLFFVGYMDSLSRSAASKSSYAALLRHSPPRRRCWKLARHQFAINFIFKHTKRQGNWIQFVCMPLSAVFLNISVFLPFSSLLKLLAYKTSLLPLSSNYFTLWTNSLHAQKFSEFK